jgi:hypothetical protein
VSVRWRAYRHVRPGDPRTVQARRRSRAPDGSSERTPGGGPERCRAALVISQGIIDEPEDSVDVP